MNFETAKRTINKDYVNLFLAKYLKGAWGITAGYQTQPEYLVLMRKKLADYQEQYDCADDLCAQSQQVLTCPPGYVLAPESAVSSLLSPTALSALTAPTPIDGQVCVIATCDRCPGITPSPTVTILESASVSDPCTAALTPPLSAYGHGCGRWNWPMNVNTVLIAAFSR